MVLKNVDGNQKRLDQRTIISVAYECPRHAVQHPPFKERFQSKLLVNNTQSSETPRFSRFQSANVRQLTARAALVAHEYLGN
jgi:hypothetical protein